MVSPWRPHGRSGAEATGVSPAVMVCPVSHGFTEPSAGEWLPFAADAPVCQGLAAHKQKGQVHVCEVMSCKCNTRLQLLSFPHLDVSVHGSASWSAQHSVPSHAALCQSALGCHLITMHVK